MHSPNSIPNHHFIVVFATTRAFILGERAVQTIPHEVINTPQELYEQCGMCLKFAESERAKVEQVLPPERPDLLYLQITEKDE